VLSNGKIEVLMTSLLDQEMFIATELGILYNMRWGIETAYDRLKNKFLLMYFTGHKTESIYQDVYATLFVHNLHQLFIQEAQIIVNKKVTNCKCRTFKRNKNTNKRKATSTHANYRRN
jgi:hypothetical protein